MRRNWRTILSLVGGTLLVGSASSWSGAAAPQSSTGYRSLTHQFALFAERNATASDAEKLRRFKAEIAPLFPGFYQPRNGMTVERHDALILRALGGFAAQRAGYGRIEREFPAAYAAGIRHFRTTFPGFKPRLPVYFLHSLGEMDGGTRTIGGKDYMIFGVDVIARIHGDGTIGPFLDHELFHVEHGGYFDECEKIWCSLWVEGLATYAAGQMNPGADDHALMLDQPQPIRPAVDADWRGALCLTIARLDSSDQGDSAAFFSGGDRKQAYPARFGYYVGYRLAQKAAVGRELPTLAHMSNAQARPIVDAALAEMVAEAGGCPR